MNSKLAKALRRDLQTIVGLDPRDAKYIYAGTGTTVRLHPGCGRAVYRRAKALYKTGA